MKKKESGIILLKSNKVANLSKVGNLTCFETIKIKHRQLQNIVWHNVRLNRTRLQLFGIEEKMLLEDLIKIPTNLNDEIHKCRIIYSKEIEKIEFEKYLPRKMQSLKVVECNDIDYAFKYYDRTKLNELFQQKENCDEILIIKEGFVTDTSISNIVFWDGQKWLTPAKPLLKGTARARLLHENKIVEASIKIDDLSKFKKARIINAMNNLYDSNDILNFHT